MSLHQVLCICYDCFLVVSVLLLTVGAGVFCTFLPAYYSFPHTGLTCPALKWELLALFIASYLSYLAFGKPALFWRGNGEGVDLRERTASVELGGMEREKTAVGIYCMRENSIFEIIIIIIIIVIIKKNKKPQIWKKTRSSIWEVWKKGWKKQIT